jgi:hypothetical protein
LSACPQLCLLGPIPTCLCLQVVLLDEPSTGMDPGGCGSCVWRCCLAAALCCDMGSASTATIAGLAAESTAAFCSLGGCPGRQCTPSVQPSAACPALPCHAPSHPPALAAPPAPRRLPAGARRALWGVIRDEMAGGRTVLLTSHRWAAYAGCCCGGCHAQAPRCCAAWQRPTCPPDPVSHAFQLPALPHSCPSQLHDFIPCSMEECEAVCGRVGIMSAGRLRALGSVPRLKHKHGQG